MTTLRVRDLRVRSQGVSIVEDVSFSIGAGERVGLIGESGSGKSLTALAILDLLPSGLRSEGEVLLGARNVLALPERERARIRGDRIAMVFQEPMTALNPTMRVGRQVAEALRIHRTLSRADAWDRAIELLARVELPEPRRQAEKYPHQLSGGQRQRVVLAIAMSCEPDVLLADEPTTALDVTVQAQVVAVMNRLVTEEKSALLLISHDLALVSNVCDRILVMYGGRIIESGTTEEIVTRPRHPYTLGLLRVSGALSVDQTTTGEPLPSIAGAVPASGQFGTGCPFASRCDSVGQECEQMPPSSQDTGTHEFACWHPASYLAKVGCHG